MNSNTGGGVGQYERFYDYLNELLQNYAKLAELLSQKIEAVARFDINTLDGIIKEEQVFVLLSRGFDSNLQSYRDKLSLKGDSLSAVIREMPEDRQPEFQLLFTKLKTKLDEVRALNEKCQSLIEERIYSLEKSIRQLDKSATPKYKPGQAKPPIGPDGGHILKTSI